MAVLRKPTAERASIGLGAMVFALMPSTIGFQDLGALLVRQPGVAARAYQHLIASPFGTIDTATFSLPNPIGTGIPHPPLYALANFDPTNIAASIAAQFLGDPNAPLQFPKVNRKDKRDSFLARSRAPLPPLPPLLAVEPVPQAQADAPLKSDETGRFDPYRRLPIRRCCRRAVDRRLMRSRGSPADRKDSSRVFFGAHPLAPGQEQIAPWASGEAPMVMASVDPDIKQSALAPPRRAATTKPARASPARAKSPASISVRNRRPSGSRLPALRAPRPRNVSPTRSISNRATNRCARRSRWPRW